MVASDSSCKSPRITTLFFLRSYSDMTREEMLRLQWADWADLVMSDLRVAHPDIDSLVTRVDVMCWGHAMIQPRVGFMWSDERIEAARPIDGIHFAGTDLSGVPLIEEAFYHGVRAADEVTGGSSVSTAAQRTDRAATEHPAV